MPHTTLKPFAIALVALGLSTQPVFAQHRRTNTSRGSEQPRAAQGSQRSDSPRAVERGGSGPGTGGFQGSRRFEGPRTPSGAQATPPPAQVAPRPGIAVPRAPVAVPRAEVTVPRAGVAVPRGSIAPRAERPVPYAPHYEPRYQPRYQPRYTPHYEPRYYGAYRYAYRPFARAYYSFRPRFHLGFGLWIGYPIAYPVYVDSYPYPYASFSYPATGAYADVGGLSFDLTPADAAVYIDDQYVGIVADFSPTRMPLSLAPGRHEVEIRAPGFMTMSFDVDIRPGEVIPYQGAMQPW
jgi:hypothetical protein